MHERPIGSGDKRNPYTRAAISILTSGELSGLYCT